MRWARAGSVRGAIVIREDRVLLADLGRLNTDVVPLALGVMEGSETAEELHAFADRLVAMAVRLQARAAGMGLVIDGEITPPGSVGRGECRQLGATSE